MTTEKGEFPPEPIEIKGIAPRQPIGDPSSYAALKDELEWRVIVVAHGADFHNTCVLLTVKQQIPQDIGLHLKPRPKPVDNLTPWPRNFDREIPGFKILWDGPSRERDYLQTIFKGTAEGGLATCENYMQGVKYILYFVNSKDKFIEALKTPAIMVIYAGHARYGRGPCFSDPNLHVDASKIPRENPYGGPLCPRPCENWADGTDKAKWGLFRWGIPLYSSPCFRTYLLWIPRGPVARKHPSAFKKTSSELPSKHHSSGRQAGASDTPCDDSLISS